MQSVEYKTIYITQNRIKKTVKSMCKRHAKCSVEYKTQSASKIFTALTECDHVTHKRLSVAFARSTVMLHVPLLNVYPHVRGFRLDIAGTSHAIDWLVQ